MKIHTYIIVTLIVLFYIACPGFSEEHNFSAGSLIIPMDRFYQPDADGGILEAYGLVYYLLDHITNDENDITVHWVINNQKVNINDIDCLIRDGSLEAGETVVRYYNHSGKTSDLTYKPGDHSKKVTYSGAPFIIDGKDAAAAKAVIRQVNWEAVDIHEASVPFAAPVYREMKGTPPKIAVMNNSEKDTGNAAILESYLRLAGICTDVYDVVTPNQIRDDILTSRPYDFLWVPHWEGYDNYSADDNNNGRIDVEDIIIKIRDFIVSGRAMLSECASVEVFEHSRNGRFLTTKGFGHNGGSRDSAGIVYNTVTRPNSQVGDFVYAPEGGHLHSFRPFVFGDAYNFEKRPDEIPAEKPEITPGNPSRYFDTVTRFSSDNTGWDYYAGGHAYGNTSNGYVVYLGGHKYAECKGRGKVNPVPEVHPVLIEFDKNITGEIITITINYDGGFTSTISFDSNDLTGKDGDHLEIDLSEAVINRKKLVNVILRNTGTKPVIIHAITVSWTGGDADQSLIKIEDKSTDVNLLDKGNLPSPAAVVINGDRFTIPSASNDPAPDCKMNHDCSWKNIAGIRYALNTLFSIQFQISNREYVRSAPVVLHPYVYQGSFEYPSYLGHFRRYNVEEKSTSIDSADWDTAVHIKPARDGNSDTNARMVFSSQKDENKNWKIIDFDVDNIDRLRTPLNVTPLNGNDTDEIQLINKLRGKDGAIEMSAKLGGIMHSAPVIVTRNSRTGNLRDETAYVGDIYGMLHAVDIASGSEKWAFIPNNQLGRLKNDRTDPNVVREFAGVDGSPAAIDIYYDHDNDKESKNPTPEQWRTILVCSEGMGGNSLFALDVTEPDDFSILWEITDPPDPIPEGYEEVPGGMGHSYRVSIGKVKWPVFKEDGTPAEHETKWVVFTATGFLDYTPFGGINVFAFDLITGERLWYFSEKYTDAINDIPGAVTLCDTTGDRFVDSVFVGDMNGRLWQLNAWNGVSPHGTEHVWAGEEEDTVLIEKPIPLWNAGIGNPISVSPAIIKSSCLTLIFGTGGTDWASNDQNYSIFAINASNLKKEEDKNYADGAGTLVWEKQLDAGEKVWSAPTITGDTIFVTTASGTMESKDPAEDIAGAGKLLAIELEPDRDGYPIIKWVTENIGKVRGSLYVDRRHLYLTTNDNKIKQIGDENFSSEDLNSVVLKSWKQH